jgi:hypothetical protein
VFLAVALNSYHGITFRLIAFDRNSAINFASQMKHPGGLWNIFRREGHHFLAGGRHLRVAPLDDPPRKAGFHLLK